MSLIDILSSIVGFFVNLILRPLTPALDFIFTRLIIVATSPLAVKRFYNLGNNLVEYATSDDHKDRTFETINKIVCVIPDYLDNCGTQQCLKKLGPSLVKAPRLVLADIDGVAQEVCEDTNFAVQLLGGSVNHFFNTVEGITCLAKILCSIQTSLRTIFPNSRETATALDRAALVYYALSTGLLPDAAAWAEADVVVDENPAQGAANANQAIAVPSGLTNINLSQLIGFLIILASNPLAAFALVRTNKRFLRLLLEGLRDPCNTELKDAVRCILRKTYEGNYVESIKYSTNQSGTVADYQFYLSLFNDVCVLKRFTELVDGLSKDTVSEETTNELSEFLIFLSGNKGGKAPGGREIQTSLNSHDWC